MAHGIGVAAWQIGLLPLLWLAGLEAAGVHRSPKWWAMAAGFFVSWVADASGQLSTPIFVSQLYPVLQAAIFIIVLLPHRSAEWTIGTILFAAAVSIALREAKGFDVILHVTAWGMVAGIAWHYTTGWLRSALVTAFAAGSVAWVGYAHDPGWPSWLVYQGTRVAGAGLWGVACWRVPEVA